jgi:hypothetical protein
MRNIGEFLVYLIGYVVLCCALGLLLALPTMWLLNWLVPVLIPGAAGWSITWLQAWGVNILSNILFKGPVRKKD